MRLLFLLLILLNLGYFLWQWPQQTNDKILPSGPLPVTPNSNVLKLLSEVHKPSTAASTQNGNASRATPPGGNP